MCIELALAHIIACNNGDPARRKTLEAIEDALTDDDDIEPLGVEGQDACGDQGGEELETRRRPVMNKMGGEQGLGENRVPTDEDKSRWTAITLLRDGDFS